MANEKELVVKLLDLNLEEAVVLRINQQIRSVAMQELAKTNLSNIKLDDIRELENGFRLGIIIRQGL